MFGSVIAMMVLASTVYSQESVKGRLLIKFKSSASEAQIDEAIGKANGKVKGELPGIGVKIVELPANANEHAHAKAFRQRADVEFAEPDYLYASTLNPNDPSFGSQWHHAKIAANTAWDLTQGSTSVIIAILDSGVAGWHPDLANQMVPGWNVVDNNSDTNDINGHGTSVAGSAAAATNNLTGVSGVGFNCKIMPMRIAGADGMASSSAMASALAWAGDRGAKVANISYAASSSATVQSACQTFMSKGGVVTISAGNAATFLSNADNPYALTVSASNSSDGISGFSNTGNLIDCAAPGEGIYSTTSNGGYGHVSGTSFAAPITAGVAALMFAANPNLTSAQCYELLRKSGDDLGAAGWDPSYGWGRVNARKSVEAAQNASSQDTTMPVVSFASPANGSTLSNTVNVFINASDNVSVDRVLYYKGNQLVGTKYAAPYSWSWDTKLDADGPHSLKAVAYDLAGNMAQSSVSVSVMNTPDTIAPQVQITSPGSGAKVGAKVSVSVSASDNVGVVKVELYVNGSLVATDTAAGWAFSVTSRKWAPGSYVLQAKAYDAAGNSSMSSSVTVNK